MLYIHLLLQILLSLIVSMAHFAQLDENNIVIGVIEVDDKNSVTEIAGINFCRSLLGFDTNWKQTSNNQNFRRQFAGIGFIYVKDRDIFLEPMPNDGFSYVLDPDTYDWKSINKPKLYIGFAPSSKNAIENLLDNLYLIPQDQFVDLGSGDGSVVVAAAKRGAQAYGIEANLNLINQSRKLAENTKVKATFIECDLVDVELDNYSIIFMYLGQPLCDAILPKIKNLTPGVTIISGDYCYPNWEPINVFEFDHQKFYVWKI